MRWYIEPGGKLVRSVGVKERIQGEFRIYIPPTTKLAEKIVMHEDLQTLRGE